MAYSGKNVSQCQQASPPTSGSEFLCCDAEGRLSQDPDCDEPNWPDFWRWGFDCFWQQPPNVLSWQQITNEINAGRPFAFSYSENYFSGELGDATPQNQTSHMRIAIGYQEANGVQMITCLDPRPFRNTDVQFMPYSDYSADGTLPAAPGYYFTHGADFFGITAAEP